MLGKQTCSAFPTFELGGPDDTDTRVRIGTKEGARHLPYFGTRCAQVIMRSPDIQKMIDLTSVVCGRGGSPVNNWLSPAAAGWRVL